MISHRRHHFLRARLLVAAGIAGILISAATVAAQQQPTLRKIEVIGLQRLNSDQVIAASGLKIGDVIDAPAVDAAADKLMRTGWFQSVDYRVRTADSDTTVIFQVAEKAVAISVGAVETIGRVTWAGNTVFSNAELAAAFGLRDGDPAPQPKLDEGFDRVRKLYSRRGYINAQIDVTRTLEARRTNYQLTIREGQQFRMGVLTLIGLNAIDTRSLRGRWTLASGSVFDDSYLEQFRTTVLRAFIANRAQRTRVRSKFEVNTKPDAQTQTIDVIITFK